MKPDTIISSVLNSFTHVIKLFNNNVCAVKYYLVMLDIVLKLEVSKLGMIYDK